MPEPGEVLADQYRIEREIGHGGMATVFLAQDLRHGRPVALKLLRPELALIMGAERFIAEIRITARLDHPHILTLIDSGIAGELPYYVMPFVGGDSLRQLLDRKRRLELPEALRLTSQIAGALDVAHREGIIHRDIKPENILLRQGEAMLTDFGIALAVSEAGGTRLTEAGFTLGTPLYMSPEQALGERELDGRSDIYSLAAVLYEMLAGVPPLTAPTAQVLIGRLATEDPTPLHRVRPDIPPGVSGAVDRALAKDPAQRFATAGEFSDALEAGAAEAPRPPRAPGRRRWVAFAAGAGVLLLAAAILLAKLSARPHGLVLGEKVQLTATANVLRPVISGDGRQLAYFSRRCGEGGCTDPLQVTDVGGGATRAVLDNITSGYGIQWSPDRRNLLVFCTIDKRSGSWLVSTLGGSPRYVGSGVATFLGSDSLLVGPPLGAARDFWLRITTLAGEPRDSIRLQQAGSGIGRLLEVPGSGWILAEVRQGGAGVWELVGRDGQIGGRIKSDFYILGGQEAANALWLSGAGLSLLRIPIDHARGRFGSRWDTIPGPITDFSLTSDGRSLVLDQGTYEYGVWQLSFADLLAGRLPESARIAQTSAPVQVEIAPDGSRLRWIRELASTDGKPHERIEITPYDRGDTLTLPVTGSLLGAYWVDSVTLALGTTRPDRRVHFALVDVRDGSEREMFQLPPDSGIADFTPVAGGWSWIPAAGDRIVVNQHGRVRVIPKPAHLWELGQMLSDPSGRRISYLGWNAEQKDGLDVGMISLDDRSSTPWKSIFAENAGTAFLTDGSLLLAVFPTDQSVALYRLTGPGSMVSLGSIPLPISDVSISDDLKRAVVTLRSDRTDAWMVKVMRR